MLTAKLGPPVTAHRPPLRPPEGTEQHIAIHSLQGRPKQWANSLLALFQNRAIEGVEWSLKFHIDGLSQHRFLLGLHRTQWQDFDFSCLPDQLAMPSGLWAAFESDLASAVMFYAAFEAVEDAIFYRMYLELPPDREGQHGGVHGCGYKWNPMRHDEAKVTRYRERLFQSAEHAGIEITRQVEQVTNPVIRQTAATILDLAVRQTDPSKFLFLDVDEAATSRRSFTLTLNGAEVAVQECVPALIRLAHELAVPEGEVVRAFLPDDPRVVRSMAMGRARDGHEFFTFYYG